MRLVVLAVAAVTTVSAIGAACAPPPPSYGTRPPPPAAYPRGEAEAPYMCTDLEHDGQQSSLCYATLERCDRERGQAETDGARTTGCQPQRPVSCFQLGGDPSPASEMCAANAEDCELWRRIDRGKNGRTGAGCEWRHGELGQQ